MTFYPVTTVKSSPSQVQDPPGFANLGTPMMPPISLQNVRCVLVQREMDFCLIGVNRKWVTVTNLF
jgi:hypothetical protein